MPGFDITSILDFRPPAYICPACRGLIDNPALLDKANPSHYSCPVCAVAYAGDFDASDMWHPGNILSDFRTYGFKIDHGDLFHHATTLADVMQRSRRANWPTMRTFFEVISRSRYFVHFATWGISHVMIGALKMASMHVPVFGFASDVENHARAELTEYPNEAPQFDAKVVSSAQAAYDAPHQKILIIDGLVAFKGSTNLTNAGPRRADRGLDVSEVVTDFQQVTDLNNRYFAPVWRRLTTPDDIFDWRDLLPF